MGCQEYGFGSAERIARTDGESMGKIRRGLERMEALDKITSKGMLRSLFVTVIPEISPPFELDL